MYTGRKYYTKSIAKHKNRNFSSNAGNDPYYSDWLAEYEQDCRNRRKANKLFFGGILGGFCLLSAFIIFIFWFF